MAQSFIALIEGRADLAKAKQEFVKFKTEVEKPITITFDTKGLNGFWNNLQQQAQKYGAQVGQTRGNSVQNNIKNTRVFIDPEIEIKTGYDPIANLLKMDSKLADDLVSQLERIKKVGGNLESLKIGNGGGTFNATIKEPVERQIVLPVVFDRSQTRTSFFYRFDMDRLSK